MTGYAEWKKLDRNVVVVAMCGCAGDWAAYIGAVEGKHPEEELKAIMDSGTKLSRKVAAAIFPAWAADKKLKWRD
jgi:hypothetical protein